MVGQQTLNLFIGVRIPVLELNKTVKAIRFCPIAFVFVLALNHSDEEESHSNIPSLSKISNL